MDGSSTNDEEQYSEYNIGYGPSKDKMFYVLMFYVGAMIFGIFFVAWKLRGYNRPDAPLFHVPDNNSTEGDLPDVPRPAGPRRRRNVRARIQENLGIPGAEDELDEGVDEECQEEKKSSEKIGAKKLRKMQEKEERKQAREMMENERAEKRKRQQEMEEIRKLEEQKQMELDKQKEEEEKKAREEKEREEYEMYLELKKSFEVNEEGQQELSNEEQNKNLLVDFVKYIKQKKVVLLEDLASHFGLRTQDAIDRVQNMLQDEIITGVIDDRGKFIYISREELLAVAKFVKQRGRINISELAAASNSLINLQQSATAIEPAVRLNEMNGSGSKLQIMD